MLHGAYLIMHVYICVFWECMSFSYSMWSEHTANMLTMRSRQRSTCRAICLSSCTRVELDASLRKISRTETWFSLLKLYLVTWYEWNKKIFQPAEGTGESLRCPTIISGMGSLQQTSVNNKEEFILHIHFRNMHIIGNALLSPS